MSITSIDLDLKEKLKSDAYKCSFFETKLADDVAHELRSLREKSNMRQSDLADKSGMKQAAISRIEHSEGANWNIKTLLRLALALDCRLKVVFQPINEAVYELSSDVLPTKNCSLIKYRSLLKHESKQRQAFSILQGRAQLASASSAGAEDRQSLTGALYNEKKQGAKNAASAI
jgi:transcriptional regulator with XRE-family HTH domain